MNEAEKIITNTIICTICGGAGHVPSDCKFRKNPDGTYAELNPDGSLMVNGTNRVEQQKLDCEVRISKKKQYFFLNYFFDYFFFSINH